MTPELRAKIEQALTLRYDGSDGLREQQKREEILAYAERYNCRVLVETGTNRGDMVEATRTFFDQVYSIEIGPNLYEAALRRFADIQNVHLLLGDAREVLPALLPNLPAGRVIFYSDAHCQYDDASPEGKAEGTSIPEDIRAIQHFRPDSVIIIDDARLCQPVPAGNSSNVSGAWPGLLEMLTEIESQGVWDVDLKNDMIRLVPKS